MITALRLWDELGLKRQSSSIDLLGDWLNCLLVKLAPRRQEEASYHASYRGCMIQLKTMLQTLEETSHVNLCRLMFNI